ncbi:sorbitol dehydrogenase-like [Babylonia areolata]|uniref:sorbitol dehydrogenase-like n=1 Tax=Babylonia areolata TaxID=304850 RepID=UPI003FD605EB
MTDSNLSAVLFEKGDLRLVERPVPEPGPGEVQLSMRSVGICGSDVKYWTTGAIGPFVVKEPMLLGHECSGVVTKLGPGVTGLEVGDRVAIEPGVPCRRCELCKEGRYNLCPHVFFLATPPDSGALARFHVHAADFCYRLPQQVSFEEGALMEPLSVGLHACRRAGVTMGSKVLVCGAGPIGLSALVSAKAMGASDVIVTDISAERLELAGRMGASHTVCLDAGRTPAEVAQHVRETLGAPPDCAVEASGAQLSVQMAIRALKPGSAFAVVGHGPDDVNIPIVEAIAREIDIRGTFRYVNTWPTAVEMVASGAIDVKPMVTHRFPLEDTLDAFLTARSGKGVKVIIDCEKKEA